MDAKVAITTHCNGRCLTCPVWKLPGRHMDLDDFKLIWRRLMYQSPQIHRILVNNTGDLFVHPQWTEILDYIESHHAKRVIMTTNAVALTRVPRVDELIISFNGYDRESYERTVGVPFDEVVGNIRSAYPDLAKIHTEIHCLIWGETDIADAESKLAALWHDFPGRVRVSYKYDNQQEEDLTVARFQGSNRIPCDYLDMLSVWPDGSVIMCAHDFMGSTVFGNLLADSVGEILESAVRKRKIEEHARGVYSGICERCNYNVPIKPGQIKYVKG